jgi:hypothetical protein
MTDVVRDGLVPNLEAATRTVRPGSPQAEQLEEVKRSAAGDLDYVRSAIPADGKFAENQKVTDALKALTELRDRVK